MSYEDSFDATSLLEDEQPRGLARGTVALWLVAISCALLLIPLYLIATVFRNDASRLQTDVQSIQAQIADARVPDAEIQELTDALVQAHSSAGEIEAAVPSAPWQGLLS